MEIKKPITIIVLDYMVGRVTRGLERLLGPSYLNEFVSYDSPRRKIRGTERRSEKKLLNEIDSHIEYLAKYGL